jgi:predicted Zn-dependent peptidase
VAAHELSSLRSVTAAEVELAKQTLKGRLNRSNSSTWRRLEERTKSLYYLGSTNEHVASQIDALTVEQVQSAVSAALKTPLTFVTRGG